MTGVDDAEYISRGVYDTYQTSSLRYSQLAPMTMFEEKTPYNNSGPN